MCSSNLCHCSSPGTSAQGPYSVSGPLKAVTPAAGVSCSLLAVGRVFICSSPSPCSRYVACSEQVMQKRMSHSGSYSTTHPPFLRKCRASAHPSQKNPKPKPKLTELHSFQVQFFTYCKSTPIWFCKRTMKYLQCFHLTY